MHRAKQRGSPVNLISQYRSALQVCESDLTKRSTEGRYRGMERVYQVALMEMLRNSRRFEKVTCEVPLEKIGGQVVDDRRHGRVDIVVEDKNSNVHAIEIKLVQLPRKTNLTSMRCLFDIGQITGDFLRLEGAKGRTSFDCVIVLHGVLLSVYGTPKKLLREFHNRMFVDFKTSEMAGELRSERCLQLRKEQTRLIKQLGLDQPFTQFTGSMHARTANKLGVITIPGRALLNV